MLMIEAGLEAKRSPRLLVVLGAVAEHGPISLSQLNDRLDVSRASIWRALDTLRTAGWVRMRLGDRAFELERDIQKAMCMAYTSLPQVVQTVRLASLFGETADIHFHVGMFTAPGQYRIVETTLKSGYLSTPLSLTDDKIAIAGQLSLNSPALVRHIRAYIEVSSIEERRVVTSGEHARLLKQHRNTSVFWEEERDIAYLPVPIASHVGLAIQLDLRRRSKRKIIEFSEHVEGLSHRIKAMSSTRAA